MLKQTKHFGLIEIDEDKIITFEQGIIGFENMKQFTILYDYDGIKKSQISYLQSLDEPALSLPIINPFIVKPDYNPTVNDELLNSLGTLSDENLVILVTLTVPTDIKNISSNLKAPFIINADTKKGCQIIVENQDYPVKYNIYDILQQKNSEKGEF